MASIVVAEGPGKRRWRAWSIVRLVVGLVLAVVAVNLVAGRRSELEGATAILSDLRWEWLVLAFFIEVTSVVAFAEVERRMLGAGGLRVGLWPLTGIALAGNSIQNSLPGGVAWASVFAYRQFRARGADDVLAAWTMVAVEILSGASLAIIAGIGVALAGDAATDLNLVRTVVVVAVVAVTVVVVVRRRGEHVPVTVGSWAVRLAQRVTRRPRGDAHEVAARSWQRLVTVTPSRGDWLIGLGWSAVNWLADCACLAIAFLAVGATVPWPGLLLAYGAGQLAANLPFTPGGLGVVEGSLAIALVAYGNSEASTVAAVLLYRVVSFWAMLPLGWTAWAVLTARARKLARGATGAHDPDRARDSLATGGGQP
ncbi:MAG: lysylphosphatidylglycerol synthase transmembrane domain-containing protein [Acidimicrobiales bacterium]